MTGICTHARTRTCSEELLDDDEEDGSTTETTGPEASLLRVPVSCEAPVVAALVLLEIVLVDEGTGTPS